MYRYWIAILVVASLIHCKSIKSFHKDIIEESFRSNGSEIYYRSSGTGEPLVVVHGGPVMDHSYLLPWFDELSDDFQLIFYDQRACGNSSVDIDSVTMTLEGFAADIENLRIHLGLENINILGHSWGGLIAMYYSTSYPQNVNAMILANSMAMDAATWREENQIVASKMSDNDLIQREQIIKTYMQDDPLTTIKKLLKLAFKSQFHDTLHLEKLDLYIPEDYMLRSQKFQYLAPDLMSYDLKPLLSSLVTPTLIIYGDAEPSSGLSAKHMANTIKNSSLIIIPECGHFPFIEKQKEFFNSVRSFLR